MSYIKYSIDGNQVCAVTSRFENLQKSPAGFGDSLKEAFKNLMDDLCKINDLPDFASVKDWESEWLADYKDKTMKDKNNSIIECSDHSATIREVVYPRSSREAHSQFIDEHNRLKIDGWDLLCSNICSPTSSKSVYVKKILI